MKRSGKIISLVIALCLIVSLVSVSAFAATSFTDVPTNQWYYKFVTGIVEKNIMSGTSATTFTPNGKVTRAQVVQTEYAMAGKPKEASTAPFTDVSKGVYYADAVNWAYAKGIAAGYGKTFGPDQSVTREQFATFLYAYASKVETADKGLKKSADIKAYTDAAKVADYALNAVKWAVGIKIIDSTSTDAKVLDPKGTLTRAQLATMLLAYVNYTAEEPTPSDDPAPSTCKHEKTEVRNNKDATCTEAGYTGDTYCTECGEVVSKGKEIAALGHDYDSNLKCTRCGKYMLGELQKVGEKYTDENGLEVVLNSFTKTETEGYYEYTIDYTITNNVKDSKLMPGTFKLFYKDDTGDPQYGMFNYLYYGDSETRTYTWKVLKNQEVLVLEYNADSETSTAFFRPTPIEGTYHWVVE